MSAPLPPMPSPLPPDELGMSYVAMLPEHFDAYQRWLAANRLRLFMVPSSPLYARDGAIIGCWTYAVSPIDEDEAP
jgi:hypothetical protein